MLRQLWALHPSAAPLSQDPEGKDVIACHGIQPYAGCDPHIHTWVDKQHNWSWLQDGIPKALGEHTTNVLSLRLQMPVLDSADRFNINDLAPQLEALLPADTGRIYFLVFDLRLGEHDHVVLHWNEDTASKESRKELQKCANLS